MNPQWLLVSSKMTVYSEHELTVLNIRCNSWFTRLLNKCNSRQTVAHTVHKIVKLSAQNQFIITTKQ